MPKGNPAMYWQKRFDRDPDQELEDKYRNP